MILRICNKNGTGGSDLHPSSVADPESDAFFTPGSGMGKSQDQDPESGVNNPDHIFPRTLKQFFGLKYLNSLMQIRDGKNSDPGWKKIWIRDKHPGSATLHPSQNFCSGTQNERIFSRKKKRRSPSASPLSPKKESPSPPPPKRKRSHSVDSMEEGELSEEELQRKRMELLKQLQNDDD